MNRHLTEREFIEYQFRLASKGQAQRAARHLRDCADCRAELERLKSRFAALDLIGEDIEPGEELLLRMIELAAAPVMRKRAVLLGLPAWIGAAAAVLVIGSLVLVFTLSKTKKDNLGIARGPVGGKDAIPAVKAVRPAFAENVAAKLGTFEGAEQPIPEQAPFAPASAIELVVLPRREKVQLTIYNSAFRSFGVPQMRGDTQNIDLQQVGGYGRGEYGRRDVVRAQAQAGPPEMETSDLTLVRESRNLTLKRGWNWLQFMWANTMIDPTSLQVEPLEQKDKIKIEQLVFPSRLRELGRWLIRSEVGGQVPFEITYFTTGVTWRAFYMGTLSLDETKMRLQGYVRVTNNSGEDYENAETRLIVGRVHILDQILQLARQKYPYGAPGGYGEEKAEDVLQEGKKLRYSFKLRGDGGGPRSNIDEEVLHQDLKPKEIVKEGLSEYFLYTIEGTETIPNQWGKRLQSFDIDDINVTSLYKYDEDRYGRQTIRFVSFANDEDHNLGKTPMPDGDVKLYSQADSEGLLSYVGGTTVKYIPVNEKVELNLGAARLVTVEPTLMSFRTDSYVFDKNKNVAGWDEIRMWKIGIANTRKLPVDIEITRGFGINYWSLESDIPYEKHDVTHVRFKLTIAPRTKRTFNYMVTTYHGVRQEQINQ
jgi:hypothetical protein